ncbi:MAG: MFS transporter [Leptolyngbya sp. UWPOB_LEPTO1]|uniref:MFS transporter n=1 Tax=Leptolyngbya sp. UWPOB_LEPTO1 TaxID=2815653 RepID=UPI001AC17A60|nr:MFS transporter [Leptolyngbya sp. UWPOB_LEPTO1]MBN8560716.1 MFS transporter [Leptolyngbya sp. UWPOB_LEPTO1]
MRTFIILWLGQLVSTIGTYMTGFALELWTWELTGSATPLALIGFFFQAPRILINLVSGVIVDRFHRKHLMLLGDTIAVLSSMFLLLLSLTHTLQLWHLYFTTVIVSIFSQLQELSYSASISLLVPVQQYTRVSSMGSALHYGSLIIAPAIAASLYPIIGINGILGIDCFTFLIALATLLPRRIPQPEQAETPVDLWQDLSAGFRLLLSHPPLRNLLLLTLPFGFVHDLGENLYTPMVLARTSGSAAVLGQIGIAAGIGGVTGAIAVTLWGGFRQPIRGVLVSMIGAGLSKMTVGLGRSAQVWLPAQFCSSSNFPLMESSETAIWMTNVKPGEQGRVFAANSLLGQCLSAIAALIAGPLGDQIVEPAMTSSTGLVRWMFGSSPGSGFALIYTSCSLSMIAIALYGLNAQFKEEDT